MTEYIYIVKCDGCEDEIFNFFTDARMQCDLVMSKHPTISQIEIERNDFGECTDHCDLGTVWSWEDVMKETDAEPTVSVFSKDDLRKYIDDEDDEFNTIDNSVDFEIDEVSETPVIERKPIPEGMTLEQLKEEMEENEDTVECAGCEELFPKDECFHKDGIGWLCGDCEDRIVKCVWCNELYDKYECRFEVDFEGWLCSRCEMAIKSRGETLTFREGSYWDDLDEKLDIDFSNCIDSSDMEIWGIEPVGESTYKAVLLKRYEDVPFRGAGYRDEIDRIESEMFDFGGLFVFHFGKDGLPALGRWDPELLNSLGNCEIIFDDERYDQACERTFNRATSKTESLNEEVSFEDLVKDSINHLTNDLGKDPWAEDFADEVIGDLERNYFTDVPEEFGKYREWCSAVACEVSRQVNKEN